MKNDYHIQQFQFEEKCLSSIGIRTPFISHQHQSSRCDCRENCPDCVEKRAMKEEMIYDSMKENGI